MSVTQVRRTETSITQVRRTAISVRMRTTIITLIALSLTAYGKKEQDPENATATRLTPVKIASVEHAAISTPVIATGMIHSSNEARPAFKIGGVIAKTNVEEGAFVREGQLLATLQRTEIDAQVQQADVALEKAKRDYARAQNLHADSVATLEQVQNANTGVKLAQEALAIAQFNRQYAEVRAPISGKVISKLMNDGEIVGPGTPIYYILGTGAGDWVVKAGLTDKDWARLQPGDKAVIRLDAYPGQEFEGRVKHLADVGNPGSGTFEVELTIEAKGKRLAAGLVAALEIQPSTSAERALIPVEALVESSGRSGTVFTVDAEAVAHRSIVVVDRLMGDKVVLASGLDSSQKVVTDGAPYLEDGQKVKVIDN